MSDDNMTVEELDELLESKHGYGVHDKDGLMWSQAGGSWAYGGADLSSANLIRYYGPITRVPSLEELEQKREPLDLLAAIEAQPKLPTLNRRRPGTVIASLYVVGSDGGRAGFSGMYIISEPDITPEEQLAAVFERSADDVRDALDRLGLTVEPKPEG